MKKFILSAVCFYIFSLTFAQQVRNLIPNIQGTTHNYWCTWYSQLEVGKNAVSSVEELLKDSASSIPRSSLNEQHLFAKDGWAMTYYSDSKKDLLLMFDDGWDVPYKNSEKYWGSIEPDKTRFPSCTGTPGQRLKKLVALTKKAGWRGVGLWICAQEFEADTTALKFKDKKHYELEFWTKRLQWSHEGGVDYWKIDWGGKGGSIEFRSLISELARKYAPGLIVEQAICISPLNYGIHNRLPQDIIENAYKHFAFSDVFRTYDVTLQLAVPTTLERTAQYLKYQGKSNTILNCDDEIYISAVLGFASGILRFPVDSQYVASHKVYPFMLGEKFMVTYDINRHIDEVKRMVNWQKIMPAFSLGESKSQIDSTLLSDSWLYGDIDTWDTKIIGKTITQAAPARIARNMPLPIVKANGESPYVVAARHPNGAVAVGTYGRVTPEIGYKPALADVEIQVDKQKTNLIGVFGFYKSLKLNLNETSVQIQVWAQDLAGKSARNITSEVKIEQNSIFISGEILKRIGLSAATKGDKSEPGLVIQLTSN